MEANLYDHLPNNLVKCNVCHHRCSIENGDKGLCFVRENRDGILYALTYNQAISMSVDPIEKKPLYHFMPNTKTYSLATMGCNMRCAWCQNHEISQYPRIHNKIIGRDIKPDEHVQNAMKYKCPSISYTYTEPTIYIEYALDIMKQAKRKGLKNIWVSNAYMTDEALDLIIPYLDAINIDYKGSGDSIYEKYCTGDSKHVLKNIERIFKAGVHVEVTTLVIPGINDSKKQLTKIAEELVKIDSSIPWHISRFFPAFEMMEKPVTPRQTLIMAQNIGHQVGLKTIHLGNI